MCPQHLGHTQTYKHANSGITQHPHPTPPHAPQRKRTTTSGAGSDTRESKMLASTVEFSTTNPRPPAQPHQPTHPCDGLRSRRPGQRRTPDPHRVPPTGRPVPSGPNSVPTTDPTPHHVPRSDKKSRTSSGTIVPAELVSVPPSSTTPDTRPGTLTGHQILDRARLCTHQHTADRRDAP